jgi:hypothetical protein
MVCLSVVNVPGDVVVNFVTHFPDVRLNAIKLIFRAGAAIGLQVFAHGLHLRFDHPQQPTE